MVNSNSPWIVVRITEEAERDNIDVYSDWDAAGMQLH